MAGHSKWAQIKRQKGKNDQARGQVFTRMAREITVAVREGGGGDINGNFRLRQAVTRAKAAGVPNDNIDRAIQKGLGAGGDNDAFENLQYEGYGPGGVAIMIDAVTDNRNRTAGDIRSYFNKCDGNLGETGSVNWMFQKKGLIHLEAVDDFDAVFLEAADAGAEDVVNQGEQFEVVTAPEDLETVTNALDGYTVESAQVTYVPLNTTQVSEADVAKKLMKLLDLLEEHDDVQAVHANFELDEALLAQYAG